MGTIQSHIVRAVTMESREIVAIFPNMLPQWVCWDLENKFLFFWGCCLWRDICFPSIHFFVRISGLNLQHLTQCQQSSKSAQKKRESRETEKAQKKPTLAHPFSYPSLGSIIPRQPLMCFLSLWISFSCLNVIIQHVHFLVWLASPSTFILRFFWVFACINNSFIVE